MSEFNVFKYKPPRLLANGYPTDNLIKSLDDRELLRYMGVPQKYWRRASAAQGMTLDPVVEGWLKDLRSVYRPLEGAPNPDMFGKGLIFHGPTRAGKTITAAALLLRLVRLGVHNNDPGGYNRWDGWCMGRFVDWQEASAVFREAAQGDEQAERAHALRESMLSHGPVLEQANWLVIDDVSRERGTEFNVSELSRIVRHRGDHGYPTIITTNYQPDRWEEVYQSEALVGYLNGEFLHVSFEPQQ